MHGLPTFLEQNPGADGRYHERSRGQAFTELLVTKQVHLTRRGGFLVLDEPEAGLSFMTQIKLTLQLTQRFGPKNVTQSSRQLPPRPVERERTQSVLRRRTLQQSAKPFVHDSGRK